MKFTLNERPTAKVSVPPPQATFDVQVELPAEHVPPGVEDTLKKLGWWGEYDHALDTMLFKRLAQDGPYGMGYYHWYEVVALESLNLLTLGIARDTANRKVTDNGLAAAMNTL